MELERSVASLANELGQHQVKGVQWLEVFDEVAGWFEKRVVG
jgi:hypothetical protein